MLRFAFGFAAAGSLAVLSGCGPSYSPNTYDAAAMQQANLVQRGVVIGVRAVKVSANDTVGTVTGAAAGGIAGSTVGDSGTLKALSALGGSVVGGLVGSGVQHAQGDMNAFEYIVRESNNNLVSVTQRDKVPLPIGQKVLVIAGKQARIVTDYTVTLANPHPPAPKTPDTKARPSAAQTAAGTPTVVPHPAPASGGGAAQASTAQPPASSSAVTASGGNTPAAQTGGAAASHSARATPAAAAASVAAAMVKSGTPAAAAAVPATPASTGPTGPTPAAPAGAPAAAGGNAPAATVAGQASTIH